MHYYAAGQRGFLGKQNKTDHDATLLAAIEERSHSVFLSLVVDVPTGVNENLNAGGLPVICRRIHGGRPMKECLVRVGTLLQHTAHVPFTRTLTQNHYLSGVLAVLSCKPSIGYL